MFPRSVSPARGAALALCFALFAPAPRVAAGGHLTGPAATYTLDADFDLGSLISVVHDPSDQLQLDGQVQTFSFLWVAISSQGTVAKIDTVTGDVVGEYRTAPRGMGLNPSRTTVDKNGNVWVANRDESGSVPAGAITRGLPPVARSMGSVVHIGLRENGMCQDRNGNGVIETSTGLGDVKEWSNAAGADRLGGATTAGDECILHFVRVNSVGTRHLSVNVDNDLWVSGTDGRFFDLIDGETGALLRQEPSVGHGGYGGLIDARGVIWSASPFMRWDTALPLEDGNWTKLGANYGLCIDSRGNVWSTLRDKVSKYAPDGTLLGTFRHGSRNSQGCVVGLDDHVWVAQSHASNSVGHLLDDGTHVGNVTVGRGPTGVAADAAGKIWATNLHGQTVSRIDPATGPVGADGRTRVGAVDFTSEDLGGNLYNYSDMTGSTLRGAPDSGSWSVVHDSGEEAAEWGAVRWHSETPDDSTLEVRAASSADGTAFSPEQTAANGDDLAVPGGRYLKVIVLFSRGRGDGSGDTGPSPILHELSVATAGAAQRIASEDPSQQGVAMPEPGRIVRFGPPVAIELGEMSRRSEAEGRLELGGAEVEGNAEVRLSTDYQASGTVLEIDLGDGWRPIGTGAVTVRVNPEAARAFPVRVRAGRCPEGVSAAESFSILVESLGGGGQQTSVPLSVEIAAASWLQCWWPLLALLSGALITGVLVHGFWTPFRFPPRLGVVLSPEEDMTEGFFHPIRAQRGSRSGFYRDARIFIRQDFRLAAHRRGAIARLRAHSGRVRIEPVAGAAIWRQTPDDSWDQLPPKETAASFGVIYRDDLGSIFFEIRNG